jgi:hypothetical protein
MEMNRKWRLAVPMAAAALLMAACTEGPTPTGNIVHPGVGSFAKALPPNGPGACLLAETQAAGFLQNVTSLNCTSNDVDISHVEVTEYQIEGGGFVALKQGEKIECTPGQKIDVKTVAFIQNNAQERYDLGFWVNKEHNGSALTGASCEHYNLVPGQGGSESLEGKNSTPDLCGDVTAGKMLTIDMGTLTGLVCPSGGATTLNLEGCAAWQNSTTGGNDRICPVGAETRAGFGQGTTPGTTAKCRCEPLNLPINVKAGVEVRKVWVGSSPPQPLTGSTTIRIGTSIGGIEVGSGLSTAPTGTTVGPFQVDAGTYYFSENPDPPTGYTSALSCTKNGNPVVPGSNGSLAIIGGDNVVCTFTNTRQTGTIELKKVWPGNQATTTTLKIGTSAGGSTIKNVAGGPAAFSTGAGFVVNTGTYHLTEDLTNLTGYAIAIACTRNGNAFVPTTVNAGLQQYSVVVNSGDAVICTFSNTLTLVSQWCSPGYWRNAKWDWSSVLSKSTTYAALMNPPAPATKPALKSGNPATVTIWQVLQSPQTYGGPAFNYVGSVLSHLHTGVDFVLGSEIPEEHECPINAHGIVNGN